MFPSWLIAGKYITNSGKNKDWLLIGKSTIYLSSRQYFHAECGKYNSAACFCTGLDEKRNIRDNRHIIEDNCLVYGYVACQVHTTFLNWKEVLQLLRQRCNSHASHAPGAGTPYTLLHRSRVLLHSIY